jgi:hypothetical protein
MQPNPETGRSSPVSCPLLLIQHSSNFLMAYQYCDKEEYLRHYAKSRKVADSIPDEVIWFLN